jgi:hydrogenase nickel incorporation protein HypB
MTKLPVIEQILSANDRIALDNRRLLEARGVVAVNIMASPGAGKTSLILHTIEALRNQVRLGVIEGDLAGQLDAEKVAATGTPVVQINTGGGCHLDAPQIRSALDELPIEDLDLLLIENVGNLVCPAGFALGEHARAVIASVPEGHDKPIKYPGMFVVADVVVLNKMDLAPYVEFDLAAFRTGVRAVNATTLLFETSCKTGAGIQDWADWLSSLKGKHQPC